MVFSKAKMIARLEKEGKAHLIDKEITQIMDQIDGKEAIKNDFKALIHGEEEYFVKINDEYYPVNKLDCE